MITTVSYDEASEILGTPVYPNHTHNPYSLHWTDYQDTNLVVGLLRGRSMILEVGTHYGYTTANLARTYPAATICTLDVVKDMVIKLPGFQEHELLSREDSGRECKELPNVTALYVPSDEFFEKTVTNGKVWDGIFIDGSHEYNQVLSDSYNALDVVKRGGVIAWHDVYNKPLGIDSPKVNSEPDNDGVVLALEDFKKEVFKIEDSWIAFLIA